MVLVLGWGLEAAEKQGLEPASEDLAARQRRAGLGRLVQCRHGARTQMGIGRGERDGGFVIFF